MKLLASLVAFLALSAALPALAAADDITVTLDIGYGYHLAPSPTHCRISVADGASVAQVLDAAAQQGCIQGWSGTDYGSPGDPNRFVDCIDTVAHVCGLDSGTGLEGTFWALYVGGALAQTGADTTHVHAGSTVQLTYSDWWIPFTLP